ncbi:hypothetical protein [Pseudarthrobacter chlorophenolicus]|uniref:hypothetical protein n=1 Tax=Pseudarthrobacter chlorophenolicus TaxID=85085 RepID=UPI0005F2D9F3|nr:hypothetical protein [Pseudarthrobacter chlorophenolicus]
MDESVGIVEPLDPHPSVIVRFIQSAAEQGWPSNTGQFHEFFEHLGCELEVVDDPAGTELPALTRGFFTRIDMRTEGASWVALDGSLFSVNLFAYQHERDVTAAVVAGYAGVRAGLIGLFGQSSDEQTDPRGNRAAMWTTQDALIELYAHVAEAPVLQVGISHRERNATYELLSAHTAFKPKP